ncbi:hypothetical protein CA850_10945 [Micromonospora echinospora]|uniref:Uncharacterized protein n=1 Tax=Micromonospora echinospora TaxID=1877 RepID=A0A1C4ZQF8_MICEC|nr:hypothetical protein [Micromonospora echinospora]OZV81671.1 hypothetical protein CA850_10945 [Micromonospora echinospora]SCF35024.1 hypothetical protein GA0070618_5583 [Micromonospora echinospora]
MRARRWVIVGMGGAVAAGLVVAAVLFGLQGVEVAGWLAGVASLVVAVTAVLLAPSGGSTPTPPASASAEVRSPAGSRSVVVRGDATGIVSTGDDTTNIQHR